MWVALTITAETVVRVGCRRRRPHLQGRFSGRLTTKEDERRLAEECKLLGPLLGGVGKRGDKSRLTLAKIVRGIATGDVRRFCEERERAIAVGAGAAKCSLGGGGGSWKPSHKPREWLGRFVRVLELG